MDLIKKALCVLICAGVLTACHPAPKQTDKNGIIKAENSGEAVIQGELVTSTTEKNITDPAKTNSVLSATPKAIKAEYKSDKRTLNINAEVVVSETGTFNTYTMEKQPVTKDLLKKISDAYFGEKAADIVYDEKMPGYILGDVSSNNYYTLSDFTQTSRIDNLIEATGVQKDLNPWDQNLYLDGRELAFPSEASIKDCEDFISRTGLTDYQYYGIRSYGLSGGDPYYLVTYKKAINDVPVTTRVFSSINFQVTEEGIYTVKAAFYNYILQKNDVSLLSLESANRILEGNVDAILIYCSEAKNNLYLNFKDDLNQIGTFNIKKIALEYIEKTTGNSSEIVPAWRYYLSPDNQYIDKNIILAVDAVSGDVIY